MNSLNNPIAKLRRAQGMDRDKLADKARISADYLRNIESESSVPHIKCLARIACALNVSLSDLIEQTHRLKE